MRRGGGRRGGWLCFLFLVYGMQRVRYNCMNRFRIENEERSIVTSVSEPSSYTISQIPQMVAIRVCIVMACLLLARGIAGAGVAAMMFVSGLWM